MICSIPPIDEKVRAITPLEVYPKATSTSLLKIKKAQVYRRLALAN